MSRLHSVLPVLSLLALLIAMASPAGEPAVFEPGSARQQLHEFANGLHSLGAGFRQIVRGADGSLVDSGEGQVWLQTPNRLRWQYEGEFPELIVADGQKLWLYDQTLEQVTVKTQSALSADSPLMLLTNPAGLERQFTVADLGEVDGVRFLELLARGSEAEFDRVMIGMRDGLPATMALEDAFGMRTDIEFIDLQRNPDLAAEDLFHFTPPPGTDVTGEVLEAQEPVN